LGAETQSRGYTEDPRLKDSPFSWKFWMFFVSKLNGLVHYDASCASSTLRWAVSCCVDWSLVGYVRELWLNIALKAYSYYWTLRNKILSNVPFSTTLRRDHSPWIWTPLCYFRSKARSFDFPVALHVLPTNCSATVGRCWAHDRRFSTTAERLVIECVRRFLPCDYDLLFEVSSALFCPKFTMA